MLRPYFKLKNSNITNLKWQRFPKKTKLHVDYSRRIFKQYFLLSKIQGINTFRKIDFIILTYGDNIGAKGVKMIFIEQVHFPCPFHFIFRHFLSVSLV